MSTSSTSSNSPPDPLSMENMEPPGKIKKSRHRIPTSCNVCRKKKVKCDKLRPFCGSCIRSSSCNSCHYEVQPWDITNDIKQLNQRIIQLKQKNAELQSLVANYEVQITHLTNTVSSNDTTKERLLFTENQSNNTIFNNLHTPRFSNIKPTKDEDDDQIVDLVKDFDVLVIKENKLHHYGSTSFMSLATNEPIITDVFGKFLSCHKEIFRKYHNYHEVDEINDADTAILSACSGEKMSEIIDPINSILPPRHIFDKLLERFFSKCYLLMPFVDKQIFYIQLSRILRSNEHGDCFFIVPDRFQLVTVSMALIFLRFSFLTLPMDKVSGDSKNKNVDDLTMEMFSREINISPLFIEHAKNCLTNSSALKKANLQIVQAFLYLKFYKSQSPEDGDTGLDSLVSLSIIIQMAKSIGLNRDPSNFEFVDDARIRHVWRKIWFKLLQMDAQKSLNFGSQLLIPDDDSYDTELPYIGSDLQKTGSANPYESSIVRSIAIENQMVTIFRKISQVMMVIKQNPKRSVINKCVEDLEGFMQRIRPFQEFVNIGTISGAGSGRSFPDRCERATECMMGLEVHIIYSVLNHILTLTSSENEKESKKTYIGKSISSALSVFKFCHDYFKHPNHVFGDDLYKLVTPSVVIAMQRVYQMVCITVVRHSENFGSTITNANGGPMLSKEVIRWLTCNKQNIAKLCGIDSSDSQVLALQLYAYMEDMYRFYSELSETYFQAWMFCKILGMFMTYLIERHPIYRDFSNKLHAQRAVYHNKTSNVINSVDVSDNEPKQRHDPNIDPNKNFSLNNDIDGNLMNQFNDFLNSQLLQLDMYAENPRMDHWANLVDENGQTKLDYFNPYFDIENNINSEHHKVLLAEVEENKNNLGNVASNNGVNDDGMAIEDLGFDLNNIGGLNNADFLKSMMEHNAVGSNNSNLMATGDDGVAAPIFGGGPMSNSASIISPNTISDIQSQDFLNNIMNNNEINQQINGVMRSSSSSNMTGSSGISPSDINNSNGKNNNSNFINEPKSESSPSEVNYGMQIAKMMFGNV
ncbi:Hap1 protein [Saccharomycopsis crataegensis]|uniref:Hap1 protein n=1 Tax=Saccharomycopsis crataegensis TaxID=43959 RepID=A0AAV5QTB8_9ASCO|nr:Hap1 protein [Saccharomycopsis crataegensis]